MSHVPHELAEEFPEHVDSIHTLKTTNAHFAKLFDPLLSSATVGPSGGNPPWRGGSWDPHPAESLQGAPARRHRTGAVGVLGVVGLGQTDPPRAQMA